MSEPVLITVAGREAAALWPPERGQWRRYADVVGALSGPVDEEWANDCDVIDDTVSDPWVTNR